MITVAQAYAGCRQMSLPQRHRGTEKGEKAEDRDTAVLSRAAAVALALDASFEKAEWRPRVSLSPLCPPRLPFSVLISAPLRLCGKDHRRSRAS
jgi:hypothetical protein